MPDVVRGRRSRPLVLSLVVLALIGLMSIAVPSTASATGFQVVGSQLSAGQKLLPGQSLLVPRNGFRLDMQTDGNLVLQDACTPGNPGCPHPLWALGTSGQPGNYLVMQGDGNLVLYSRTGRAVWATQTAGTGSHNIFAVQTDSNMVVYSGKRPVWSTGRYTSYVHVAGRQVRDFASDNGQYTFFAPGNGLSIAKFPTPNLGVGTSIFGFSCWNDPRVDCGSPLGRLILQTDGNLVWYQPGIKGGWVAEWSTNTWGMGPTNYLVMQNNGNLVLYDLWHRPLWNSLGLPVLRVH